MAAASCSHGTVHVVVVVVVMDGASADDEGVGRARLLAGAEAS